MESKTIYFENSGSENTNATLSIAKQRAKELGIKTILVASTEGDTALKALESFQGLRIIVVSHVTGIREPDTQEFTDENKKIVEGSGSHFFHSMRGLNKNEINLSKKMGIQRFYLPKISEEQSKRFFKEFDKFWDQVITPYDQKHSFWRNAVSSKMQEWEKLLIQQQVKIKIFLLS